MESVSPEIEALIERVKGIIDSSCIDSRLKGAFKSTVGGWGGSNAQELFKQLLVKYDIIDSSISGIQLERVRGVFKIRNGIVHKGEIRMPNWVCGTQAQQNTAMYITGTFIPEIVQAYINRRFGLMDLLWPKKNILLLQEYIDKGSRDSEDVEVADDAT